MTLKCYNPYNKPMDKKLAGLISFFFLTFFVFISVLVFGKPLSRFTRAAEDYQPSAEKSLIFAWPLSAGTTISDTVKIDVFVRSESGKPIPTREILMNTTMGTITPKIALSDKNGKATFSLSSQTRGTTEISAVIDNTVPVTQRASVKFD